VHSDTFLAVVAGRGTVNPLLRRWAERFERRRVFYGSDLRDHVACRRNTIVKWFRDEAPPAAAWLLMVDDDVVPFARTDELLRCPAEVAAARVWARTGREAHPHGISAACVKISRKAARAIPPPWFRFVFSPDGTREVLCECRYFWRKCHAAGFTPVQAGIAGHRFPVTVLPEPDGPAFRFDGEVEDA